MSDGETEESALSICNEEFRPYFVESEQLVSRTYQYLTSDEIEMESELMTNAFNESKVNSQQVYSITTIEEGAFRDIDITSITIGDGITTINEYSFEKYDLISLTIGGGIRTIGEYAFADNYNLQNVQIDVDCDMYKTSFTNNNQFRSFDVNNITWKTACSN